MVGNRATDSSAPECADSGLPSKRTQGWCLQHGDALLIVDVQNDFLPDGALPVPSGDRVIPPLNRCIEKFQRRRLQVIATRDWHPKDHCSFDWRGGHWPPHCVQGTEGAQLAGGLNLPADCWLVDKATDPERDAFSGFAVEAFDRELRRRGIGRLIVAGLATEYCVRDTVLDALHHGFRVVVLRDAIRPIDVTAGDGEKAIREMAAAGAEFRFAEDLRR